MAIDADAHAIRGDGAIAQGLEGAAEARGEHAVDDDDRQREEQRGHVEILDLAHALDRHVEQRNGIAEIAPVEEDGRRQGDAKRAARQIEVMQPRAKVGHLVDENLDDGAKRQRHHREIGAGDAQRGQGQHDAKQRGDQRAGDHGRPEAQTEMDEQATRRIGANAEQRRVADRHLAGVAEHDVEAERDDGEDRRRHDEVQVIGAGDDEGAQQDRRRDRHEEGEGADHDQTFLIVAAPNRPEGLIDRTSNNSNRPGTSL